MLFRSDIGEFVGGSLGGMLVPPTMARLHTRNPVSFERRAVQSVMDRGLPVDAGAVTGNPVVRGAQWLADRTLGGSLVATRANARARQAYARDWEQLAARTGVSATDKFAAGERAQDAQATMREAIGRGYATAAEGIASRIGGSDQTARQTGTQTRNTLVKDRKSTRLNSSHVSESRMPSSA